MSEPEILSYIAGTGVPSLLLALGLRYMVKVSEKQAANNEKLIARLDQERSERLDAMEAHIEACDKDRNDLRQQLMKFLTGAPPEHSEDPPTTRRRPHHT